MSKNPGTVYLLHFSDPVCATRTAQHYIGWSSHLEARLNHHRNGTGACITAAAAARGIEITVVRKWQGSREVERGLKKLKASNRLCPICSKHPFPVAHLKELPVDET